MGMTEQVIAAMGTTVSVQVVSAGDARDRVQAALAWFPQVEAACSRFDPHSALRLLTQRVGVPVPVSPMLFEALAFAVAVADASGGAFDPTVGALMEARGFHTRWQDGRPVPAGVPRSSACWRDVELDANQRTVTLHRPMLLDLGAVAKGLAVDLAAAALADLEHFAIDAGGDLYCAGHNANGMPWTVGIQHPRDPGALLTAVTLTQAAVCTSGDYARRSALSTTGGAEDHHLHDPRTDATASTLVSASVIAPRAMVADALATAAFVLGPTDGLAFLQAQQVDGLLVTPSLDWIATPGFSAAQTSDHASAF